MHPSTDDIGPVNTGGINMGRASSLPLQTRPSWLDWPRLRKFREAVQLRSAAPLQYLEDHFLLLVGLFFLIALAVRLFFTPYDVILREDAFWYWKASWIITLGDFSPNSTQHIGWPLFMSPFLYFFNDQSMVQQMQIARTVSVFVGALSIIPLAYIGKYVLDRAGLVVVLILFTFSAPLIKLASSGMSEPLFILWILTSLYFSLRSSDDQRYLLLSALFAAFAYWVRPNGIFLLPVIFSAFFLLRPHASKANYRYLIYIVAIFFLVSTPFLYQRYDAYGSPFSYGENGKYFVDSYRQVWSENIQSPSLVSYLKTHSFTDHVDKFVINGTVKIAITYGEKIIPPLLAFPFLYAVFRSFSNRRLLVLVGVFLVWIISLTPVFSIYGASRHLIPTIPLVFVVGMFGCTQLLNNHRHKLALLAIFALTLVLWSVYPVVSVHVSPPEYKTRVMDGFEWGQWAAQNLTGKLAVIEGADLIEMNLLDPTNSGIQQEGSNATQPKLEAIRPGDFNDLSTAMIWFKEIGVTHLLLDDLNIQRRPYLKEIAASGQTQPYLREVYSNYDTGSRWKVRILEIDWSLYGDPSAQTLTEPS